MKVDLVISNSVNQLSKQLTPEYIEHLAPYLALCARAHELTDSERAIRAISKLSEGLSLVANYVGAASYLYNSCKFERKQKEAIASLEKSREYAAKMDMKLTDAQRTHYVQLDPDVAIAYDKENLAEAMVEQLSIIKQNIIMSLSAIKAAHYGYRPDGQISGNIV